MIWVECLRYKFSRLPHSRVNVKQGGSIGMECLQASNRVNSTGGN